ncbi:unnamed protein product [Prunus brigantina]
MHSLNSSSHFSSLLFSCILLTFHASSANTSTEKREGTHARTQKRTTEGEERTFHHRELSLRDSYSNQLSAATSFYSRTKKGILYFIIIFYKFLV